MLVQRIVIKPNPERPIRFLTWSCFSDFLLTPPSLPLTFDLFLGSITFLALVQLDNLTIGRIYKWPNLQLGEFKVGRLYVVMAQNLLAGEDSMLPPPHVWAWWNSIRFIKFFYSWGLDSNWTDDCLGTSAARSERTAPIRAHQGCVKSRCPSQVEHLQKVQLTLVGKQSKKSH